MPGFLSIIVNVLASLAISTLAFVLGPRSKISKPKELRQIESPTSEMGKPIPMVFGDQVITSPNVLWYGDKSTRQVRIQSSGKKG